MRSKPPLLLLDTRRPFEVVVLGVAVPLRPAEWKLLWALVQTPGQVVTYNALWHALWQEPLQEPGQIYAHASRLRAKLRQVHPLKHLADLIRTIPKRGIMLDARPNTIEIHSGCHRPSWVRNTHPAWYPTLEAQGF